MAVTVTAASLLAAMPLAALGFLNLLIAAAAMAFSSLFVVANNLRLRRFHSAAWAAFTPHWGE